MPATVTIQKLLCRERTGGADKPGWPYTTGGSVYSSPAIAQDGTIYAGSYDGKVYALNPNGTKKWEFYTGDVVRSSPSIGLDGTVYVGSQNYKIYALDPNTGLVRPGWPYTTGFYVWGSPVVAADATVFIGSYDGKVYALNPDGTAQTGGWPYSTGGAVFSSPVIGSDGVIYVGSGNGKLYAFSNLGGLAHTPWAMFRQNPQHTGNPATLTLSSGSRQPNGSFLFQINGLSGMNCTVEGSENLGSWATLGAVTLAGGAATFTDAQAAGFSWRFYRVRSGAILSYNSLGYVAVNIPSGYSMVANQLDNPAGNTVAIFLPNPPNGTTLNKWNEATQQYNTSTFSLGVWSNPNMTLSPGEGALVQPGSVTTFTFIGNLRQGMLGNPFPSGLSIRSSIVPQAGPIDTMLSFPSAIGDTINRYTSATASYDAYTFTGTAWLPSVPIPRTGESFWINTTAAKTWTRNFAVW